MSDATRAARYRKNHRDEVNRRARARRAAPEVKALEAKYAHTHLNQRNNRLGNHRMKFWERHCPPRHIRESLTIVSLHEIANP